MKKLQLIIFLLFIGVNIYAQGPLLPNTFVQPGPDSSGYTGPDMIVFDREGNQYRVSDLIFEKPVNGGGGQSLTTPQTCTAGIFRLHFADFGTGLGFDDPLFPQANVIACQVFTDISQLLNEANSPYTSIPDLGNGAYVEIEVRPSWNNAGNPTLGSCGQYHYQSSPGIVHGSVWQTINSGIDSWFGTNATNLGNFGIYHGLLQVNFGHPFYYGANPSLIPANEYDFYTMILHEAMHGLGFGSLINSNGASKIAPGIYSKYDTFLKENSTGSNLIIDGGCYTQTYNPSVATSNLITPCTIEFAGTNSTYNNLTTFNGSGVTDRGGHGYFSVRQVGFGKNAAQATFDNCHYGITGVDINLRSSDNKMTNMDMGYRIDYSSYMSIDINDNLIWSKMNGIDLRYNDFAEHVIVERNEIHFGDPSIVGTKGHSAIQMIEQNGDNPYSIIHDNDIFYNVNSTNARNGIYLNSAANYKVTENTLTMFNNLYNSKGIYSFGSVGTEISCNDILGSSNNYTDKYQSAITVTMNDGPTVACNTVNGTYNGIYFSGPNHHTDVKGNNIHTHVHGVHLDNSAIIGNQDYRGNLWYQAAVGTGVNAVYDNALNALTYTWKVDGTVTIPGSNPVPMTSAPTGWIIPNAGNNFECSQNGGYCNQFFTSGGGNQDFEHQIANGSLQNNPFTDETKWMLKGDLYKRLDENQSLMTGDATLTNFYNQAQTQLLGQFKDIKDVNESLFYLDAAVRNNLNQNKLLLEQKLAQLNADMEQLRATNLTAAQIASIKADISALQIGISNLLNYNKTALGLAATTRILNADNTKVVNDGLYTSEIIEQNEKEINSIYFATIAKGIFTFTSSQASTILGIAEQCPQAGGRAVPVARGFYDMIDESKTYDDPATCLAQGIVLRNAASNIESGLQEKAKEIFRPYFVPNPAKQSATLFYKFDENKTGVLYLSNYLGQLVKTQELKANDNAITITTGSLADGIYHYKVISNGEEVGNGKLAVIK